MFTAKEFDPIFVESDGRLVNHVRDPPGQRSVYIPPGDPHHEVYRLSTYKDYPTDVPINICRMAAKGFYYTGYKDRVKCFSCGQATENWISSDDISSREWHKEDCNFINGRDRNNIPINSFFQTLGFTENSARNESNSNLPPTTSADTTRPNFNGQSSSSISHSSSSLAIHQRYQSRPTSVTETRRESQSARFSRQDLENEPLSLDYNLTDTFPCLFPVNPHMRNEANRLQTFLDNRAQWPSYRTNVKFQDIAAAGMYYLGMGDRVKCWYCNGGLQNWKPNEVPWMEHAKWFPTCEYLLQQKGPDFVHGIIAQYPNLRRPTPYSPAEVTFTGSSIEITPSTSRNPPFSAQTSNLPLIVDTREELQTKVAKEMNSSNLVSQAKEMGFQDRDIRKAIKRQFEVNDQGFSTLISLVEEILSLEGSNEEEEAHTSTKSIITSLFSNNETISTTIDQTAITQLEDARNCKICRKDGACVVLIPCGHLACCVECGKDIKKCPICNSLVRETIRSYIV